MVLSDERSSGPSSRSKLHSGGAQVTVLVLVAGLVTVTHLCLYTGFALDDWFVLAHAQFDGMWHAGEDQAGSQRGVGPRPGQWLIFAFTFGLFGRHPIPYVLLLGVLTALISVSLLLLLGRFVPRAIAFAVSALWLLLPNHTTMEVWASALNIAAAVLCTLVGFNLGLSDRRRSGHVAGAALLFGFAAVSYEATIPIIVVGVVALPFLQKKKLDWTWIGSSALILSLCAAWTLTHWGDVKQGGWNSGTLGQVIPAHFGWGIVPDGPVSIALTIAVLIVSVISIERLVVRRRRPATRVAERLIVAGWAVILVSLIPFLVYVYGPVGVGDRANCVSSIGGAMVLVGCFQLVWKSRREVAWVVAATVLVATVVTRVDRTRTWSTAFEDADRILAETHRRIPEPEGLIVFGPAPIQNTNIAAFLDQSNINSAVRVEYGDPDVRGAMAFSRSDFRSVPPDHRIDIRPLSRLVPDVDLSTD